MMKAINHGITTKDDMKRLVHGDLFCINGEQHIAVGDSHISGDSTCDEYVVYDEEGNCWFESDFLEVKYSFV